MTDGNDVFSHVLKIISEETGVAIEQLTEETNLAELGVDSLLALMIGSRLRDELDIDVDTSSVLGSPGSISSLREALFPGSTATAPRDKDQDGASSSSASDMSGSAADISTASSIRTPSPDIGDLQCATAKVEVPPATSVVLQGSPRTATSTLFIFPDGGGLASSYASLPRIRDDLVVYGLNSPYLKKGLPEDIMMDCTWDGIVGSYIAEVRRRQPRGPYSFGGWSAGGILSYRAAQMLMAEGEVVRDLIMIDSPAPENLKQLPEHFFEYCATSGLFGASGGVAPAWLIAHFRNINRVLSTYRAEPLAVSTLRKANILWACESSVDESFHPQPDDPEDMKFLTERRTDFTAGKWTRLFPGVPLQVDRVEGRHHWNLLVSWR